MPIDRVKPGRGSGKQQAARKLLVAFVVLALATTSSSADSDAELDNLAAKFSNSLSVVNNKLGFADSKSQPVAPNAREAEELLSQLYNNLESLLADARQRSALARSSLLSSRIDTLRLV